MVTYISPVAKAMVHQLQLFRKMSVSQCLPNQVFINFKHISDILNNHLRHWHDDVIKINLRNISIIREINATGLMV